MEHAPSDYFKNDWQSSREKIVKEFRELIERGQPMPQEDWSLIWVFSGPEATFEDKPNIETNAITGTNYPNQTRERFETGIRIVRAVTALRLRKQEDQISSEDIKNAGPILYFNGRDEQNEYLRGMLATGENKILKEIPANNIVISTSTDIENTGHQFIDFTEHFPHLPPEEKTILVSDLYHLPRIKRYAETKRYSLKKDTLVLYPTKPYILPFDESLAEIQKILPYEKKGFIDPTKDI